MLPTRTHFIRRSRTVLHERGSITLWFVLSCTAMIIMVGLAVDLGGQVHTQQRAQAVAAQAARAGGQQINGPRAIRGIGVEASPAAAAQAARAYLRSAGVSGSVRVSGGTLTVRTSDVYHSKFLQIIGLSTLKATGRSDARIARVVNGSER